MNSSTGPLRVGIGGPVGSGKTALMESFASLFASATTSVRSLTTSTRKKTPAFSPSPTHCRKSGSWASRPAAVRTRRSAKMRPSTSRRSRRCGRASPTSIWFWWNPAGKSVGDFSPELADLTIYVIDVAGGEKIPRKGGPGITRSDLLVVNKIDLAPYVGADLAIMEADTKRMRGNRPYVFSSIRNGVGIDVITAFIERAGGLSPTPEDLS